MIYNNGLDLKTRRMLSEMILDERFYVNWIDLEVNCDDVFEKNSLDGEAIDNMSDINELYKFWKINPQYGPIKWACLKRKHSPRKKMIEDIKLNNLWCEAMINNFGK